MQTNQRSSISTIFLNIGAILLIWMSSILLFSVALFFLPNHAITCWNLIIPSFVTLLSSYFLMERKDRNSKEIIRISIAASVLFVILSILGVSLVYDNSWDGQDYQQKAVLRFAEGYNPLSEIIEPQAAYDIVPINHYPKAPWMIAASIYQTTGNLESGKATALLFILASFFITFSYLCTYKSINLVQISILSALIAFNPVSVSQYLNFYVDGIGSSVVPLLIVLMLWASSDRSNRMVLTALGCIVFIGLNIKFTTTAYVGILTLALFAYSLISFWLKNRKWKSSLISVLASLCLSGVLGLLLLGYNPYVLNTVRHGNPFYPIYGNDETFNKDYVMSNQLPEDFEGKGPLYKLFRSFFAKTWDIMEDPETSLKFPFSVSRQEILIYRGPDLRIGGFGPWFGGILILTILCMGLIFRADPRLFYSSIGLISLLLFSGLANEASWWARYTPQFWFIPVVVLSCLWISEQKPLKTAAIFLAFAMVINLSMVAIPYTAYNVITTVKIDRNLRNLAQTGEKYMVYLGPFAPWEIKLRRHKLDYVIAAKAADLPCPQQIHLINYSTLTCIQNENTE